MGTWCFPALVSHRENRESNVSYAKTLGKYLVSVVGWIVSPHPHKRYIQALTSSTGECNLICQCVKLKISRWSYCGCRVEPKSNDRCT